MIDHYLSQIKSYLAKYLPQLGAQSTIPFEMIPPTPQLNKNLILELMLQEYTNRVLGTIKDNLETEYKETETAVVKQVAHSKQHIVLVQKMNDISLNLIKVRAAINNLTKDNTNAFEALYKELNLKPYK